MTRRVRLATLSHAQIGALFLAWRGQLCRGANRWYVHGRDGRIRTETFNAMEKLGLVEQRKLPNGRTVADLTPQGFVLADLAVTLSRQIAAAIAGRPQPAWVEGEPPECDGSAWERLPPAVRADQNDRSTLEGEPVE